MKQQSKQPLQWVRLDNAAKIYPAARRKDWSNVFRQSVTLTEDVDKEILEEALVVTVRRFPSIAARLRRGAFWYYLEQVAQPPEIREEYSYPLVFMDRAEVRNCAFRVIVWGSRIAVEFFHSLTDGTGAMVFLKNLTAEYLQRRYGISVPETHGIVDRTAEPAPEELEDSFLVHAGPVAASRRDTNAWRLQRQTLPDGFLHVTCVRLPVREALDAAHQHNATLTVLLSAVMMEALTRLQRELRPGRRQKPVKLLIPVNLRQLFPSKSLRNFALYTTPQIDPRLGTYSLQEICDVVRHKMGAEITPKHMASVMAANVGDERNPVLRLVPLPLKNLVMKAVFERVGERKSCMTLSNLGQVKIPEEMAPYVRRFDFILGVQADAPYNCGVVSYDNMVYINFIRSMEDAGLERHFCAVLRELGLTPVVESNLSGKGKGHVLY